MTAKLRFWILTVGMTLLIWISADQQVKKMVVVTLPLHLQAATKDSMSLKLVDQEIQNISLTFTGPNRDINELKSLNDQDCNLVVSDRESGKYKLNLLEELSKQMEQFQKPGAHFSRGVILTEVFPVSVTVEVDRYVPVQLRLTPSIGEIVFVSPPQLEPAVVTALVPEEKFKLLRDDQKTIAVPVASVFDQAPEGEMIQKTVVVPREFSGLTAQSIEPPQVTASGIRQQRTLTGRIPTVPIQITSSPDIPEEFHIAFKEQEQGIVTRELSIRGPAPAVRACEENPAACDVRGIIEITQDDALKARSGNGTFVKVLKFINLPVGVEIAGDVEPVEIVLTPRSQ